MPAMLDFLQRECPFARSQVLAYGYIPSRKPHVRGHEDLFRAS